MRRLAPLASLCAAALAGACAVRPPVTSRLELSFPKEARSVVVTSTTEISDALPDDATRERMRSLREAMAGNRDEWSLRFAAVHPSSDRLVVERTQGEISRIERRATIDIDELPRFFDDMSVTVSLNRGAGVADLSIIPAASTRATRQQRERVLSTLHAWSSDAAAYVEALSQLYRWLDRDPQRASAVFKLLMDREERSTVEEEQALIDAVTARWDRIVERLDRRDSVLTVDEEFDLVFNPFPAEITVHAPVAFTAVENFDRLRDDTVVIRHAGLLDAVEALEGRWISPDPLSAMLQREETPPEAFAKMPRHWPRSLTAAEIEKAVIARLTPASVYHVRWNE